MNQLSSRSVSAANTSPKAAPRPGRRGKGCGSPRPASVRRALASETKLAQWIAKARAVPEVRRELVQRVKAEIAAGNYETPEKLRLAVERLLEELI